jgi:flagellar protein FlgJ
MLLSRHARLALLSPLLAVSVTAGTLVTAATAANASVGATIRTSGGTVKVRSGPTTKSTQVGVLRNKATITIACWVTGETVKGTVRKTSHWDRLTNGQYVSDAYVRSAAIPICPPPPPAPSSASPGPTGSFTNAQFLAASVEPAQQSWREFGVPASVTIAQAILESGWGRSGLSTNDRNYFGIKCFSTTPGPIHIACHNYVTSEYVNGSYVQTTASFRVYASMTDSFRDHGRFLTVNSRYKPAFVYTKDPNNFVIEIAKAGYATSPTYATNLTKLMVQYNLYQYDIWK